jgi:hypothetical protein
VDGRITARQHPPRKLRRLQPLYKDNGFVADWHEHWFAFVDHFRGFRW